MRAVLGLKLDPWHDTGAAIVLDDGARLRVAAISQERLNRVKHARAFPAEAIGYCLEAAGCRLEDLSLVVADFIFTPGIEDCFKGASHPAPDAKRGFFRALEELGIPILFAEHHVCHAASAFYATEWEEAAAVVIDGHGSNYETQTIFGCRGNGITKLATSRRPGVGWMYCAVTECLLGFQHLQDGKTMGLAGWAEDGGVWTDLFRGQAEPGSQCELVFPQFAEENKQWKLIAPGNLPRRRPSDDPVSKPFAQYAYAAQAALEAGVMDVMKSAAKMLPGQRLCYSGGVALNIPANRLIVDSGLYEDIFIQPAASDSGIPLGAALFGYHCVLGGQRRWKMEHAFLGREYSPREVEQALNQWRGNRAEGKPEDVARLLANDYLVAWCQGASEFGPRALGHRSILCAPRHPQMKAYLNHEVKHREMFRPFAPIVPSEDQADYFDLGTPSPFMLINARVHASKAGMIPAIVHADGTARVQSVSRSVNPELHGLLKRIGALTGVPVLLNTSLNLAGEPIVESPADVVDLFARSRLDALVIGTAVLTKAPLAKMLESPNAGLREFAAARESGPVEVSRPKTVTGTTHRNERVEAKAASVAATDATNGTEGRSETNGVNGELKRPRGLNEQATAKAGAVSGLAAADDLDLWLDEFLTVAGEGAALVIGPGATEIIGQLVRRGIDARGVDTYSGAPETAFAGRSVAGTLNDAVQRPSTAASALLINALDETPEVELRAFVEALGGMVSGTVHVRATASAEYPERNRVWWEEMFFAAGFRKHPRRWQVLSFEQMDGIAPLPMYFERAPASAQAGAGAGTMTATPIGDPTRASGREADLMLLAYELAAPLVRPWDTVLDIACGCGAGTHLLRRSTRASRFIACEAEAAAMEYANAQFGAGTVEFQRKPPGGALMEAGEGSVDFAILGPSLTAPEALAGLLRGAERVLAPGGRLVFSLSPGHRPAFQQALHAAHGTFLFELAWGASGNEGTEAAVQLRRVPLNQVGVESGETLIVALMKDPLCKAASDYRETAFRHVAEGPFAEVLRYPEFYEDPWILHSMVHAGMRLNEPGSLAQAAQRLLSKALPTSADAGAALCILLYRAMDGIHADGLQSSELEQRAAAYLKIGSPNAHQFRWQVSLGYALGQLAMHRGDLATARERFAAVAEMDALRWGPSLTTKTSEASFLSGWLAWCAGEPAECRRFWSGGLELGRKLLARPLDETLINAEFPSLFDYGDGMRETIYALENVAMCANGLHCLRLRERGISVRWDLIRNSFRIQRDQRDRLLRQAQQRVASLCKQLDATRQELRQRGEELDLLRAGNELGATLDAVAARVP
jgi:carbamoyltransferase